MSANWRGEVLLFLGIVIISSMAGMLTGWIAMLIFTALAITSNNTSVRSLGKRWKLLHRLVYLAAIQAVVHHFWLIKADLQAPLFHATWLAGLFAARLAWRFQGDYDAGVCTAISWRREPTDEGKTVRELVHSDWPTTEGEITTSEVPLSVWCWGSSHAGDFFPDTRARAEPRCHRESDGLSWISSLDF